MLVYLLKENPNIIVINTNNTTIHNPLVLAQHEHPERLEGGKASNLVNLVVVEVKEDEAPERGQVLYVRDGIVLVVQQPQLVLTLQDGAHGQLPPEHNSNVGVVHERVPER